MELFHMIFHILVIFATAIQLIEAGLITPLGSMNSVVFRPMITTFGRGGLNSGYIPNNSLLPFREATGGLTYINPASPTPLGNGANTWFYVNRPTISKGVLTQNPWYPGTSPAPVVYSPPTEQPTSSNTPDYDAILAERFPGAFQLLEKLKRLNKIKDAERQKALAAKIFADEQNTIKGQESPDYKENSQIFKPHEKNQGHKTNIVNGGRVVLKKLKKKKFYHKAKPVRPVNEDEVIRTKEIVYFIDD